MKTPPTMAEKLLRGARKRIAKPEAWIKGFMGKDLDQLGVNADSPRAVAWCLIGALECEAARLDMWLSGAMWRARDALVQAIPDGHRCGLPMEFNDAPDVGHADVLKLYDRAIEEVAG